MTDMGNDQNGEYSIVIKAGLSLANHRITNKGNVLNRTTIIFIVAATLSISDFSIAGQTEVKAAEAIATTITLHEKCTGDGPSPAKMERIVNSLLDAGMTPKDFVRGSKKSVSEIEHMYPGRARPPKNVCNEAKKLYDEVFGSL